MPWVVTKGSMPPVPSSLSRMRISGSSPAVRRNVLERGADRRAGVVEVLADGGLDLVEEALALVDDEGEAELVAVAELLVEGLAADAGGGGDVRHRDLRPGPPLELVAQRRRRASARSSSRAASG